MLMVDAADVAIGGDWLRVLIGVVAIDSIFFHGCPWVSTIDGNCTIDIVRSSRWILRRMCLCVKTGCGSTLLELPFVILAPWVSMESVSSMVIVS